MGLNKRIHTVLCLVCSSRALLCTVAAVDVMCVLLPITMAVIADRCASWQIVLMGIVAAGVYRTNLRIPDWKDEGALFESAVSVCPNSAKIRMQYAKVQDPRDDSRRMVL